MKQTIFENWSGKTIDINNNNTLPSTPDSITQNLKTIHTMAVSECLKSYKPNPILAQSAPNINVSEQSLPRKTRRILAQLRAGKSPVLTAYLHTIDPKSYPSPICSLCKSHDHTTQVENFLKNGSRNGHFRWYIKKYLLIRLDIFRELQEEYLESENIFVNLGLGLLVISIMYHQDRNLNAGWTKARRRRNF